MNVRQHRWGEDQPLCPSARKQPRSTGDGLVDPARDALNGVSIDHGAQQGRGIPGIADDQLSNASKEEVGKPVVGGGADIDALHTNATLAGMAEAIAAQLPGGLFEVGVGTDDVASIS